MRNNAGGVAECYRPGPTEMAAEGVDAPRLAHERDPSGGADRQETAAHPRRESDEEPLPKRHIRIHRKYGKHQWNVVHDRRQDPDRNIGHGWPEIEIQNLTGESEIAQHPETRHSEDDAEKEQQRIPLYLRDLREGIEHHVSIILPPAQDLQHIREKLQVPEAEHHAERRLKSEEIFEAHRGYDSCGKKRDDPYRAGPHAHAVGSCPGFDPRDSEMHDSCGHDEIEDRRNKKQKEAEKIHLAFLPHHERCDIAER